MKKVSFIFSAKDDDYVKNFINRMEFSVNYNLEQINKIKKIEQIEFVIIDWGSNKKISEKFRVLNNEFKDKIKFYYFTPEIAEKGNENLPGKFNQEVAINCGIQRATGSHLLIGHHDILFSKSSWSNIFRAADDESLDNSLFWIPRFTLDKGFATKNPSIYDVESFLDRNFISKKTVEFQTMQHGGGSAAIFSHKKIIVDKFGLSENLKIKGRFSGVDADIWQKISINFDHLDSFSQGIFCHKLPIYSDSKKIKWLNSEFSKRRISDFRYNLDYKNVLFGLNNLDITSEIPKTNLSELSLEFKTSSKNLFGLKSNIYYGLKNYYHSLIDNLSYKEIIKTRDLLKLMISLRFFSYLSVGLPLKNRVAVISKNFSFLKILFFIHHTKKNNSESSHILQKINRFYNRSHEGYYRFILDDDFENLVKNFKNLNFTNYSCIIEVYINQFDQNKINEIVNIIIKNKKKVALVVLSSVDKNINDLFYQNFKNYQDDVYINLDIFDNIEKNLLDNNSFYNLIYYIISLLSILLFTLKKILFGFKKYFEKIFLNKIKNLFR